MDQMYQAVCETRMSQFVREEPHSLRSHGLMIEKEVPYLILDRLSTPDCHLVYMEKKRISSSDCFVLAKQALEQLARYHQQGMIHQDIKLRNMQFNEKTKQLKLFDFGLSRKGSVATRRGTPQYMAPELIIGKLANESVDIWGLGCALFALYTGQELVPYEVVGEDRISMYCKIMDIYSSRIGLPSNEFLAAGSDTQRLYNIWGDEYGLRFHARLTILPWEEEIRKAAGERGALQEAESMIELLKSMFKYKERISAKEALKLPCLQCVADFSLDVPDGLGSGKTMKLLDPDSEECLIEIDLDKKRSIPGCYHIAKTMTNQYRLVIEDKKGAVLHDSKIELLSGSVLSLP